MKVKTDVKAGVAPGCPCGATNTGSRDHNRLYRGRHTY